MDSTIRLRQLNQAELSGFVSGVFNLFPKVNISGNLISSGSGIADIGSATYPYAKIFANQLNIATGSGINFGNTSFRAYTSGGFAYVDVGGIKISSSGENIYVQGPSGVAGPSGATGATGVSGIGISGVSYNTSSHILTFTYTNGGSTGFNFQGLSGATGVSVTGFFRSGIYIYPQYDHFKGTGSGIQLLAGPPGPPGSVSLYFEKSGLSVYPTNFPLYPIIDPYYDITPSPPISMQRGMVYTVDASGLHTHTMTADEVLLLNLIFTGTSVPFTAGTQTNYFKTGNTTGYWRFSLFPYATATGYYEGSSGTYPTVFSEDANYEAFYGTDVSNIYRTSVSAAVNFRAQNDYKYGFMVYTLPNEDQSYDQILQPTGYAYVLGSVSFASGTGPQGPPGPASTVPGPSGSKGDKGEKGDDGAGISSYIYSGNGNDIYIQFILDNGVQQAWIPLPAGGPSGLAGPSGAPGSLINVFSGVYSAGGYYPTNSTITYTGSCFINTGVATVNGIAPPAPPWMLIASGGAPGPSGASGASGAAGSISNHWSGTWNPAKQYPNDYIVFLSGSSYVNTGSTTTAGVSPPNAPWQMLAQKGDTGAQGAAGVPTALRATGDISLVYGTTYGETFSDSIWLDPYVKDIYSLTITSGPAGGDAGVDPVSINISGDSHFGTGQTLIINIRNEDVYALGQLFKFESIVMDSVGYDVKWPNGAISFPLANSSNIYTILRFADRGGVPEFYGTYSNPY